MPHTTELTRRVDNLLRLGTIAEVDLARARVRVQPKELKTDGLPWFTLRAGTTQSWSPPTVGEQCIVLSIGGELTMGVVLVGLYTQNAPSQSADEHKMVFADGTEVCYDQASGHLSVKNCKTAEIHAAEQITADTPLFVLTGDMQIDGKLDVTGEVTGKKVKLSTHKHKGVTAGKQITGAPLGSS